MALMAGMGGSALGIPQREGKMIQEMGDFASKIWIDLDWFGLIWINLVRLIELILRVYGGANGI